MSELSKPDRVLPLQNRRALVTGASRGIGKAIAVRLAREGIRLVISASNSDQLESAVRDIRNEGGEVESVAADLSSPDQAIRLAHEAVGILDGLDILINNAGTALARPLEETTLEEWSRCLAVNATAPFLLCRECLPALEKSDWGTIFNVGSVVAIKGYKDQAAYGASKHALLGFSKVLAQEVQNRGIRVHCINPGGVATDMIDQMRPDLDPSGLIRPEEIADLVIYLSTHRGNAMIDDVHLRRAGGDPWY